VALTGAFATRRTLKHSRQKENPMKIKTSIKAGPMGCGAGGCMHAA
jgi:hypothetical protein